MPSLAPSTATTLPQWIGIRAEKHGARPAVTFVDDDGVSRSWSYRELWGRVCQFANQMPKVAERDPRALLLFPPGLEFIAGFLGAHVAGWIPVPTCYPKPGRVMERLDSAARDCQPSALISDAATLAGIDRNKLCEAARGIPQIATDASIEASSANDPSHWIDPHSLSIDPDSIALLQYTSGSTSEPKGVMVRHRNVMANLAAIKHGFKLPWQDDEGSEAETAVFWLPFFHDMGLIGGLLAPLYSGYSIVLMSPRAFLQRPIRWLQLISDYKATVSGAPNFAYQLCIDRISPEQTDSLDLSHWTTAFCGAEPIVPRTLTDFAHRFSSSKFSLSAFYPCYGLAEATLLAAGGDGPAEPRLLTVARDALRDGRVDVQPDGRGKAFQKLVACGSAAQETELLIVDPQTREVCAERRIGEIWLRGASVTAGYWNRDEENQQRFAARTSDDREGFFRSGDLGFFDAGQLYVTGRIKDVVILRGRNLYPQDIEATVRESLGSNGGPCAAFAVEGGRGEGLAIIAEIQRHCDESLLPEMIRSIRRSVIDIHEVDPRNILLVRPATVPLTSSGKIQRHRCRELFAADEIRCKYRYDRKFMSEQTPLAIPRLPPNPTATDREPLCRMIEAWLAEWLVVRAGVQPDRVELDKPFADYGLDSMTSVELSGETEDWSGIELTPVVAWSHPTITQLSLFIANELIGDNVSEEISPADATQDMSP
ncbi:Long-chain-fatty-acid--AMP ligase FadD26 [Novipirellula galeiformis]|uniref:Long-chain-fatty-acid--AMP ligase FadD26 n=1 Tax=Novipirellula galeiformis TaxID=2528004 RepID=A0A5C6CHP8_9BACT|nr:AMP-binding protein [Novipirellula galeiformis]TWU23898.1 Long-chain-fatty-acid--AMP ligase FadD26 [Novipirellula galeiformis]